MYLPKHTRAGFTLTELLVVIAIISILSGIVLINVNVARNKGKNARAIADVSQYLTGLALARERDANGDYPDSSNDWMCLGGSGCLWEGDGVPTDNEDVNEPLEEVMPSLPTSTFEEAGYRGYQYRNLGSGYEIRWFLYGQNRNCELGEQSGSASNITLCTYTRER